ncbi:hypothetical protein SKAU_G00173850 [Synaphobranchus kaupii]|uniref:Uncharacterized protein n=1 Tax=Synaphobranchus kaupii TaxID=118154 RepID=A0A9Q1FLI0_SYNKA|nr:hypothetical protein SKAU_G00173850 [Synaphobranchus kaupii]
MPVAAPKTRPMKAAKPLLGQRGRRPYSEESVRMKRLPPGQKSCVSECERKMPELCHNRDAEGNAADRRHATPESVRESPSACDTSDCPSSKYHALIVLHRFITTLWPSPPQCTVQLWPLFLCAFLSSPGTRTDRAAQAARNAGGRVWSPAGIIGCISARRKELRSRHCKPTGIIFTPSQSHPFRQRLRAAEQAPSLACRRPREIYTGRLIKLSRGLNLKPLRGCAVYCSRLFRARAAPLRISELLTEVTVPVRGLDPSPPFPGDLSVGHRRDVSPKGVLSREQIKP